MKSVYKSDFYVSLITGIKSVLITYFDIYEDYTKAMTVKALAYKQL